MTEFLHVSYTSRLLSLNMGHLMDLLLTSLVSSHQNLRLDIDDWSSVYLETKIRSWVVLHILSTGEFTIYKFGRKTLNLL